MRRLFLSIVLLTGTATVVSAQTAATLQRDLESTLQAAQAAANRPGDESLDCEALQNELFANAKHPAVQSRIATAGAWAQDKQAAMNPMGGEMTTQGALTLFGGLVPGGDYAAIAAARAQAPMQQAQVARNLQQSTRMAQDMMGILPQMMRGQRVVELARARNCAWLQEQK